MLDEIQPVLARLVESGSSPTVQGIAAWCTILGVNFLSTVQAIFGHFSSAARTAEQQEATLEAATGVLADPDKLYRVLDSDAVMRGIALPVLTAREIGILKAFHSIHPDLTEYVHIICNGVRGFDPLTNYADLPRIARSIAQDMREKGPHASAPFSEQVDRLVECGFNPLLQHLRFLAERRGETDTVLKLERLLQWEGGQYENRPEEWVQDLSDVYKGMFKWPPPEYEKLKKRKPEMATTLDSGLGAYMRERNYFFEKAFTFTNRLLMAVRYLDLRAYEPTPRAMTHMRQVRSLENLASEFASDNMNALVGSANKLILRILDSLALEGQ
jgi:hypothetical protein